MKQTPSRDQPTNQNETETKKGGGEQTDLVYYLGVGSAADNWELRMSLRSFVQHFKDLGHIYIIGYVPAWLDRDVKGVTHIPMEDAYKSCKDANLLQKLVRAALIPELSDKFIRSSDDQLLLRPSGTEDFKPFILEPEDFVAGQIKKKLDGKDGYNKWHKRLFRTHLELKARGFTGHNYEGHIPYPFDKERIPSVLNFDYGSGNGYTVQSLFFNSAYPGSDHPLLKFSDARHSVHNDEFDRKLLAKALGGWRQFLSFSDGATNCDEFRKMVHAEFPHPTKFEKEAQ
jgi:hypothetical protein